LAKDLNVKTSTIYHRLHKLRESNILERFTIVVNPEEIGLTYHTILNIRLKKMVIGKLDTMFLESFAKFLSEQFEEVLFTAVGDDEQIWIIATFRDKDHYLKFLDEVKQNPYIDTIGSIQLGKILKGKKLYSFMTNVLAAGEKGEYFDDEDEVAEKSDGEDDQEEESDNTSEVFF
jgi:DNA-binding Lrp family transcriptional regulator